MKHKLTEGYWRLNAVIPCHFDIWGIVPVDHNLKDNDSASVFSQLFLLMETAAIVTLVNSMLDRTYDGV